MQKTGKVYFKDKLAGRVWLDEIENLYGFQYNPEYLKTNGARAVSFTLPLREEPYLFDKMIPFFDGLIPEGWLLDIALKNWKLDANDRMGLLLTACEDCIGAVYIKADGKNEG
jgi:serine/threonine-protein kinase HipA